MSATHRRRRLAALLGLTVVVAGRSSGATGLGVEPGPAPLQAISPSTGPLVPPAPTLPLQPPVTLPVPAALFDSQLDLRAAPVAVPLQLEMPSLKVSRPVLAVGITQANVMDAPEGRAQDPVWQDAFWYRGGGIPGQSGTATIAGHVDDSLGRPVTFAHLDHLRPGDPVIVHDLRSGLAVRFVVTTTASYSLNQAASPSVLARIYGTGPASGKGPQPAADGLSHLTLITCSGTFDYHLGTHDHRLVVYATRVG